MPKFQITMVERHVVTYEVTADSREHLEEMLEEGDPDVGDMTDEECVGAEITSIKELP